MILLKKLRLINWYGFVNETAPIGFFTLIAGKNGNGKSVMLDAIKYAAYGDTVFNKSSESKGSRTLSSYTRGLLDATAGTYMRPASKVPNVYSHIVLEFYDKTEEKSFILGTAIETNAANNCQSYRYVMDRKSLEEVEHVCVENGIARPYTASELQKRYRLTLLNREQGLPRFMQMTGLKLTIDQLPTYLRKLRGIMSYDPNAKIDRFIRESVLEEKNVDFSKLIEARENIERLNGMFSSIQDEIGELEGILAEYDGCESEKNRLLTDDIKISYKKIKGLNGEIERRTREQVLARQKKEETDQALAVLNDRMGSLDDRLMDARVSLNQLDSAKMIEEEKRRLAVLEGKKKELALHCRDLEDFQTKISEILHDFLKEGGEAVGSQQPRCKQRGINLATLQSSGVVDPAGSRQSQASLTLARCLCENKEVLASLCSSGYPAAEKRHAVEELKKLVDAAHEKQIGVLVRVEQGLGELGRKLNVQLAIVEECKKHRNAYGQIPEYVGLRDEINKEFAKRGIPEKAQFACEYVIGISDESWRDAIEAFLGPRRYSILVEPQYYDIADDVLNRSQYKYAHLFNTKLLMRKEIKPEDDSVVHMLEIKNLVAKKYFDFQLGRMHGVKLNEVRNFENAISREGRVSVAMDSFFLRFEKIRAYYLGQKTFELNRIRAEKEMQRLNEEKKQYLEEKKRAEGRKNQLKMDREAFKEYQYDVHRQYQETAAAAKESETQLKRLKKAQQNNREYLELSQTVARLQSEKEAVKNEQGKKLQESSDLETTIQVCGRDIDRKAAELKSEEAVFGEFEIEAYSVVQKAVEIYEKYLENGKNGPGGLLAIETRGRIQRSIEQHKKALFGLQAAYNAKHADLGLPTGEEGREIFAARKDRIWMDNLQEVCRKLKEQTRRYEDIFKNEFVLTILKYCRKAREDLKQINSELSRLNFSAKYQFDVHYVKDSSEYARIIEFAEYLDEREKLGTADGQMTFGMFTSVTDEVGEQLEKDLKQIINRIIEKNSEETIARFADYRNYMTYEILISNQILDRAKLSRQTGFNSGAEVQIPYLLILSSALLMIYNQRVNSTRLVFIDEPFAKMDPGNVKLMLDFMKKQKMQVIFCSPDKTESIGNECEVILPVLRVRADSMLLGIVQFHKEKANESV